MTARIIPFMLRNTFDEYNRRRGFLLSTWWDWCLKPARLWLSLWR